MLNKKLLGLAIAATLSTNAFATIDLTSTASQTKTYASETIGTLTNGFFKATNLGDANDVVTPADVGTFDGLLDLQASIGFTIGNGTSKYVRVNLTNATFTGDGALANAGLSLTIANGTASVAQGGAAGQDFVIFEVAATADIPANATYVIDGTNYNLSGTQSATVAVATYETAADAVNESASLFNDSVVMSSVVTANNGTFATAGEATATVASQFTLFDTNPATNNGDGLEDTASIGQFNSTGLLTAGSLTPAGAAVALSDIITVSQVVKLNGDVTTGNWFLATSNDCETGKVELVEAEDNASASLAAPAATNSDWYVCVENVTDPLETIAKASYTVELVTDEITNDVGEVKYNSTSIEVPYLTTFADYNQRLYIINNGNADALYSLSFTGEDGVTITPKDGAEGTVAGNSVKMIKATDIVELSGKTRVSATLEVEGTDANIGATTQIVNLSNGGTDTIVLN